MKVAIAGYGLEGKSNYNYWHSQGHDVTICDEREIPAADLPPGAQVRSGPGVFAALDDFDMVVRTAGLDPAKIKTKGKIWSATNEFFTKSTTDIIGVTGTKGKGTTASLVRSILEAAGKKTVLLGNIGRPALDALDEANDCDVVVYELSSFQLWDVEKSPQVAIVLMIEPDHLDVHHDMDDYLNAKANIIRHQTDNDICYYHPTNQLTRRVIDAGTPVNKKRYAVIDDGAVYVKESKFFIQDTEICSTAELRLPGAHNLDNACAAISAVYDQVDHEAIKRGLNNFKGLDHRLKFVAQVDGVDYYDDSIATTPGSAMAALTSFESPKVIILGGSDKGADFTELITTCQRVAAKVIAIGQTGDRIAQICRSLGVSVKQLPLGVGMSEIVATARAQATAGSVVILSPACASFDMFSSYADRGDQFIGSVRALLPSNV